MQEEGGKGWRRKKRKKRKEEEEEQDRSTVEKHKPGVGRGGPEPRGYGIILERPLFSFGSGGQLVRSGGLTNFAF